MKTYISALHHIVFLLPLYVLTGCARKPHPQYSSNPNPDNSITVTLNIPGIYLPSTRSIAGTGGEMIVGKVDMLIFEKGISPDLPEVLAEHVPYEKIIKSIDQTDLSRIKLKPYITENPNATTVVVLANVEDEQISAAAIAGAAKQEVLAGLRCTKSNPSELPEGWKWKTNEAGVSDPAPGVDFDPIPMYGERTLTSGITAGMNIGNIEMIRMLARIDILNVAEKDFILIQIIL